MLLWKTFDPAFVMNRKLKRWVAFLEAMSDERICLSCWAELLEPYLTRLGIVGIYQYNCLCF